MKKTVLAIGLVLALSLSVAAASFEFYGGGSYNTFSPDALNKLVDLTNDFSDEFTEADGNYHTLGITKEDLTLTEADEIKSGFGAFGGVRYWVNPTMAVGGEIEYFGAKSEGSLEIEAAGVTIGEEIKDIEGSIDASINASVTGFSGAGAFKASPELTVFASAGYYYLNGEVKVALDDGVKGVLGSFDGGKSKFTDSGLGFKAGVAYAYPVADELSILGRVAYRSLKFDEIEFDDGDDYGLEDPAKGIGEIATALKDDVDFSGLEVGLGIVYSF